MSKGNWREDEGNYLKEELREEVQKNIKKLRNTQGWLYTQKCLSRGIDCIFFSYFVSDKLFLESTFPYLSSYMFRGEEMCSLKNS